MPAGIRLIRAASFDPETTHAMGQAYDQACAGIDQGDVAHCELIAKCIIEAARRGERDIARLAAYGREKALQESPTRQSGTGSPES
jgi:hypothetical protein